MARPTAPPPMIAWVKSAAACSEVLLEKPRRVIRGRTAANAGASINMAEKVVVNRASNALHCPGMLLGRSSAALVAQGMFLEGWTANLLFGRSLR